MHLGVLSLSLASSLTGYSCLGVMCSVIYLFIFIFRVWSLCQGQTMNLGAKGWMDWLLDLLNTTSKVLDLPSGKSFLMSSL